MISTNDFRTGVTIEIDGQPWVVVDFQHVKPGKGSAFVRAKIKNVITGVVLERTFNAGEKVPRAHVERQEAQYLYSMGDELTFMDVATYEQIVVPKDVVGQGILYLKENTNAYIMSYEGQVIGVEIPNFVELEVVETEPGFKGDTATGGTKQAKLETGAVVKVPLFVNVGDVLKIDTRTGEYIERV
ncbi:MAG TPA: elongation factor P [Bacillota bacterium]|nr:elongation factor P [Candidatus Fermentithermobacillaceae bacterium]HOB30618.1 elongation factor P [Bacillota bacterium]HOK64484.1 elongation factor P [Bacillota bacterium]HOL11770.1 elongation factor P [Bacillota bacterium]HOQ02316.1 elongation factor P [Bacillota bacterium]